MLPIMRDKADGTVRYIYSWVGNSLAYWVDEWIKEQTKKIGPNT